MLKVSKKWSYALQAMIYIAQRPDDLVKVSEISEAEKIPESLLRRIISDLDKTEIIHTIKWRSGGVKLWKKIDKISLYDIFSSVWEELWLRDCTKWEDCDKMHSCTTTKVYWALQWWMNALLKMYTLDKII